MFTLRPYQKDMVADAVEFFASARPGDRRLYSSPTGTGKSVMELALLSAAGPGTVLLTPSLGIIAGMLDKLGVVAEGETAVLREAEARNIWTPVRLRNRLADAVVARPARFIIDEAHHDAAGTYQHIHALCNNRPAVGLTASPFRGTPQGTAAFHKSWNDEIYQLLSYTDAAQQGYIAAPTINVWPLVDDDVIEVANGEIKVRAASDAVRSRMADLVECCKQFVSADRWDRPTMFSFPSVECAEAASMFFGAAGLPVVVVTGDTGYAERQNAFARCIDRTAALLQVRVVSEGVDLPIRRLIDCSPTLSPVLWLQQVGRIMRPTEQPPDYICTNRNLERHAYLLDGLVPAEKIGTAQQAFGSPSKRAGARAIGLEALGRFKATPLPMVGGVQGVMYAITCVDAGVKREFVALAHPSVPDVLYATRENVREGGVVVAYGRWRQIEALPDLTGYASAPGSPVTDKQQSWWRRSANRVGLDADATPNRRQFVALPVLTDLGVRIQ